MTTVNRIIFECNSQIVMSITNVSIKGLFGEFDYSIDLCGQLTYIHSPNGYGKSTAMHLITAAFKGDVDYISETQFERMDISFDDESKLIVENNRGKLLIQISKNGLETQISSSDMEDLMHVCYIGPERLVVKKKDAHISPALESYAQELYENILSAKEHSALIDTDLQDIDTSDVYLENHFREIKAKLDYMAPTGIQPTIPSGMRLPPTRYELTNYRDEYILFAEELDSYLKNNYILAESIITFIDIVNSLFIGKKVEIGTNGKIVIRLKNGSSLPLNRLSSGEKQILIMFYNLLFHADANSLVIIDEPEISLHVSWQQRLGSFFYDICRVRNIQMIVATHSPQIIHDRWDNAVELRSKDA